MMSISIFDPVGWLDENGLDNCPARSVLFLARHLAEAQYQEEYWVYEDQSTDDMSDDWNDFAGHFDVKSGTEPVDAISEWRKWFGEEEIMLAAVAPLGPDGRCFPERSINVGGDGRRSQVGRDEASP